MADVTDKRYTQTTPPDLALYFARGRFTQPDEIQGAPQRDRRHAARGGRPIARGGRFARPTPTSGMTTGHGTQQMHPSDPDAEPSGGGDLASLCAGEREAVQVLRRLLRRVRPMSVPTLR